MTKKEIEKIIDYLSIKSGFSNNFMIYSKMYGMTTENISGFLNKHDLKDKKVLTVAGSGDQRYNAYLNGAKEVVCFDVNSLAELNMRLKDTAMKELNYTDFLKFFGVVLDNKGNLFLDNAIFNKFNKSLDEDVYMLYDFIINKFKDRPLGSVYYDLTDTFSYKYASIRDFDNYIMKSNYLKVADIISNKDINFLNVNVASLPEVLGGEKFDMILLSNISDYVHMVYKTDHMKKYKELIDKLVDNLYDGGIIQIGYIYSRYERGEDTSKFRFPESRNKYFPFTEYPIEFVKSFYNNGTYDEVITYKKK